jgi:hypothetical protein
MHPLGSHNTIQPPNFIKFRRIHYVGFTSSVCTKLLFSDSGKSITHLRALHEKPIKQEPIICLGTLCPPCLSPFVLYNNTVHLAGIDYP